MYPNDKNLWLNSHQNSSVSKTLFFLQQTSLFLDTAHVQRSYKCEAKTKGRAWWILQEEKIREIRWRENRNRRAKKGQRNDTTREKKVHSFTQQLSANITILSTTNFGESRLLFLSSLLLQELADSELALQETYQDHFAYSIILELVLWYLFLEQELHALGIFQSQVFCNSIQQLSGNKEQRKRRQL